MAAKKHTLHVEAFPKAVKRALRADASDFTVLECRASDNTAGEHGKTTLIYTFKGDEGEHTLALAQLTKQANIEQDHLLRDDEEDA